MAGEHLLYGKGQVRLLKGTGTPANTDAIVVYGEPAIVPNTEVLDDPTYTPQGDANASAVGQDNPEIRPGVIRAEEFTVPSADDASRPNWSPVMECSGYKTAVYADKTTVTGEDTGLRGDGSVTRFVFLTLEPGIQAAQVITITDGTQTITIGTDDAVTGDGSVGVFDRTLGFFDVTFTAAPAADATIAISYKGGYRLLYDRSNSGVTSTAVVQVTKEHDDQTNEDVHQASGCRFNTPLTIGSARHLEFTPVGSGSVADADTRTIDDPTYPEQGAQLVWDETCKVVIYTVEANGANVKAYVGQVPTITLDPGFEFQRPEGAITPGYTAQAQLVARNPLWTLDLWSMGADELDLQALLKARKQFVIRAVVPGTISAKNLLASTGRGQIIDPGTPSEGFGGKEQRSPQFKLLTMGNELQPTVSATSPRHQFHAVTLP